MAISVIQAGFEIAIRRRLGLARHGVFGSSRLDEGTKFPLISRFVGDFGVRLSQTRVLRNRDGVCLSETVLSERFMED
jgi:hypothetical protein